MRHKHPVNREHHEALPRSVRMAEATTAFMGSPRFLVIQTLLIAAWIGVNVLMVSLRWDPYPFILLNLAFSTQAAYAAPLILLAQNRTAERDRKMAEFDYEHNARSLALLEGLHRDAHGQTCHCLDGLTATPE